MFVSSFVSYFALCAVMSGILSAEVNPLNGQHLRILTMEFPVSFIIERNASGYIIHSDGVQHHMIEALSQNLNFSYIYLPIVTPFPDDSPSERGGISYLVNDEADFYMTTSLATAYRLPKVDYPAAWAYIGLSTLLPYPKETTDLAASFKPFSYEVWILISISTFSIALYLKFVLRKKRVKNSIHCHENAKTETNDGIAKRLTVINSRDNIILEVFGNLVSQGQHYFPKRLAIRVAAGAWCCGAFFLVQIYCSTLTSHLTSPHQKPIVNSFFEIVDTPGVSLTIDRGYAMDKMMQIAESSSMKRFVDNLKKENRIILCNITSDCLDYVKRKNAVYCAPVNSLSLIMSADLKNSSTCRYTRAPEIFWQVPAYSFLRKNSPYTEAMSRGILRLQEFGLLDQWEKWYVPPATKCMKINERNRMPRLSIEHLSSAFVILIAGYLLSLSAFLIEKLICFHRFLRAGIV